MVIKSKFNIGERVIYGTKPAKIVAKRYDSNTGLWMHEVENKTFNFKAWASEEKLTLIK